MGIVKVAISTKFDVNLDGITRTMPREHKQLLGKVNTTR